MAQTVKGLSTMRETQVRSLGWEELLEKEMAIHSSTIAWKIPWTEEPGRLHSPWGCQESDMTERLHLHLYLSLNSKQLPKLGLLPSFLTQLIDLFFLHIYYLQHVQSCFYYQQHLSEISQQLDEVNIMTPIL